MQVYRMTQRSLMSFSWSARQGHKLFASLLLTQLRRMKSQSPKGRTMSDTTKWNIK
jgi:hypothetical protein